MKGRSRGDELYLGSGQVGPQANWQAPGNSADSRHSQLSSRAVLKECLFLQSEPGRT